MDYHHHARLTIVRREELAKSVLAGRLSLKEAEAEFKLSRQSVAKWVGRYRDHGVAGLKDRSSLSAWFVTRHVEGEDHGDRAVEATALDRRASGTSNYPFVGVDRKRCSYFSDRSPNAKA